MTTCLLPCQAQTIISDHIEYRRQERAEKPERFDRQPTLGELAVRHPAPPSVMNGEEAAYIMAEDDDYQGTMGEDVCKSTSADRASQGGNSAWSKTIVAHNTYIPNRRNKCKCSVCALTICHRKNCHVA